MKLSDLFIFWNVIVAAGASLFVIVKYWLGIGQFFAAIGLAICVGFVAILLTDAVVPRFGKSRDLNAICLGIAASASGFLILCYYWSRYIDIFFWSMALPANCCLIPFCLLYVSFKLEGIRFDFVSKDWKLSWTHLSVLGKLIIIGSSIFAGVLFLYSFLRLLDWNFRFWGLIAFFPNFIALTLVVIIWLRELVSRNIGRWLVLLNHRKEFNGSREYYLLPPVLMLTDYVVICVASAFFVFFWRIPDILEFKFVLNVLVFCGVVIPLCFIGVIIIESRKEVWNYLHNKWLDREIATIREKANRIYELRRKAIKVGVVNEIKQSVKSAKEEKRRLSNLATACRLDLNYRFCEKRMMKYISRFVIKDAAEVAAEIVEKEFDKCFLHDNWKLKCEDESNDDIDVLEISASLDQNLESYHMADLENEIVSWKGKVCRKIDGINFSPQAVFSLELFIKARVITLSAKIGLGGVVEISDETSIKKFYGWEEFLNYLENFSDVEKSKVSYAKLKS